MVSDGPHALFAGRDTIDPFVHRRLRGARTLALFLDYDGTLTPIAPTRESALPGTTVLKMLRALVALAGVRVAIVTGRSLSHLPRSIRASGADLAVDHGVRIVSGHATWIHPGLDELKPVIREVYVAAEARLGEIPGIRIEQKRWSVDIHYRQVHARHVARIRTTMADVMRPYAGSLKLTRGKKVLEARPAITWSKGHAILKLLARPEYEGALPIFIGDDRTDEDGFRALRGRGITIHVGRSRRTAARYAVRSVPDVLAFLAGIIADRSREKGGGVG